MKKAAFQAYLRDANFRELFITEMGWNNYQGQAELKPIVVDETEYQFRTIAERNGFQILVCEVDAIPSASLCRHIDTKLRGQANDYIAIYVLRGTEHHLWVAPVRQVEKRNIVTIEYETAAQADFLFSKIADLSFELDEQTTIVDVKQRSKPLPSTARGLPGTSIQASRKNTMLLSSLLRVSTTRLLT